MVKEQNDWESKFDISGVWRNQHLDTICTTWVNGVKYEGEQVWTRIDKIIANSRTMHQITNIDIARTKLSDHDVIVWSIEIEIKQKRTPLQ